MKPSSAFKTIGHMHTKAITNIFIDNPMANMAVATGTISGGGIDRRTVVTGRVNIRTRLSAIPINNPKRHAHEHRGQTAQRQALHAREHIRCEPLEEPHLPERLKIVESDTTTEIGTEP